MDCNHAHIRNFEITTIKGITTSMSSLIRKYNSTPLQGLLHRVKICHIINTTPHRNYASSSSKGTIRNWLLKRVYGTIIVVAVTGTGLVVVSTWIMII